jgi:hypothetical protein
MTRSITTLALALLICAPIAAAPATDAVDQLLNAYKAQGGSNFSAERGQALWQAERSGRRCTSCHTADPRAEGKHHQTRKPIAALAPSANPKRLTNLKTVRKWFKRNCKWTLGRECTAQEKGDFLIWISQQ